LVSSEVPCSRLAYFFMRPPPAFLKQRHRDQRAGERRRGEIGCGARCGEMPQRENEQAKAQAIAEETEHCSREQNPADSSSAPAASAIAKVAVPAANPLTMARNVESARETLRTGKAASWLARQSFPSARRCSRSAFAMPRISGRYPPLKALRPTRALPARVFGPVDFNQDCQLRISTAWRARRSGVQPLVILSFHRA
jgi:hypothetical protein